MHVQTKEALQNKNTQSITWWNTSTNQVANSHDDAMHMNMYMTLLHSHTHTHKYTYTNPFMPEQRTKRHIRFNFFHLTSRDDLEKKAESRTGISGDELLLI